MADPKPIRGGIIGTAGEVAQNFRHPFSRYCGERDRLFKKANNAIHAHWDFVSRAVNAPHISLEMKAEECDLRIAAQDAWEAYRRHIKQHGC